jgi:hypothetical protein
VTFTRCAKDEQWLKYVVVAAVDQDDLGISEPQRVRRRDPGKAADDHDTLALGTRRLHDVGRHGAHWVAFVCAVCPFMASATPFREQRSQDASHSGLLEPRGTSTDLKEPGARDMIMVIP